LSVIATLTSCRGKEDAVPVLKTSAINIPAIYKPLGDPGFHKNQDTLFYQDDKYCGYVYQLSEINDTVVLFGYWKGLEEGVLKKWYPHGQLQERRYYITGKKNGIHTGWWENGNKKFEFTIIDDFYEGNFKEWNHSGKLIRDFNYVHGQEQGSEKLWWDDGTIRANYVVDKGRKYGLIGLKICRNPYDSIKLDK
jgi:antitoxin component YwqK of YwqJK toxin-antitoxin module